ncbi:MAG: pitrilysin family protein, partial [Oscillospiraceae bacterium]|nr:pitrilysin family protein [Oscillospiraceae bacterium]
MQKIVFDPIGETLYSSHPDNGPQIFVSLRPGYAKAFALFAVRYGGNDLQYQWDKKWKILPAGTAHFLEHKLFDTKDGGADQLLATQGALSNAFTTPFMTAYYFECTENFEQSLKILLQFVSEPYFTKENVAKEQGIIGQEIQMGADNPELRAYYNLLNCLYLSHPIKDRVIGTVESIREITPELLYDCHEAFYNPSNMVLCVAGDVSPDTVEKMVLETLHPAGGKAPIRNYGPAEAPVSASPRQEETMEVSAPLFYIGWKQPLSEADPLEEQLTGELACELLFGSSSPLYARLYADGLIDHDFG